METLEIVRKVIRENLDFQGEIKPEDHLINDLHIDSFDMIMIVNALEDNYSIIVEDEDLEGLTTVNDVVQKLKELKLPH